MPRSPRLLAAAFAVAIALPLAGCASGAAGDAGPQGPVGEQGQQGPEGEQGARGLQGDQGLDGATGPAGPRGSDGTRGTAGATGLTGPTGATGPAGSIGATGPAGPTGAQGVPGPIGATGPAGPTGAQGVPGPQGLQGDAGSTDSALFFALMPGDNAATVAVGADVDFPQNGPTTSTGITRSSADSFDLATAGVYRVTVNVPVTEAGQLVLTLDGTELAYTVTGRATGTSLLGLTTLVETTTANQVLTVRNPAGNPAALTITPLSGGANPASATLLIELVAAS